MTVRLETATETWAGQPQAAAEDAPLLEGTTPSSKGTSTTRVIGGLEEEEEDGDETAVSETISETNLEADEVKEEAVEEEARDEEVARDVADEANGMRFETSTTRIREEEMKEVVVTHFTALETIATRTLSIATPPIARKHQTRFTTRTRRSVTILGRTIGTVVLVGRITSRDGRRVSGAARRKATPQRALEVRSKECSEWMLETIDSMKDLNGDSLLTAKKAEETEVVEVTEPWVETKAAAITGTSAAMNRQLKAPTPQENPFPPGVPGST